MFTRQFILLYFVIGSALLCSGQKLTLSTKSDSAIHYYYEGWRQVMDVGNYTASEAAYRKALTFDKDFLVGLSLLGRITRDLDERKQIESTLKSRKSEVKGDERLLLDNYIELITLTNLRETDPGAVELQMKKVFALSEKNLTVLVHRYPDDIYYKAEYIEVLHRNHGPQVALDSLYRLASDLQQSEPFLLGYAASLEAEQGNYQIALIKADKLAKNIIDKRSPKPYVVHSDIYLKMGELAKAKEKVEIALQLDPGNIDAQRLKKRIEQN